jgi:hypothetical protein
MAPVPRGLARSLWLRLNEVGWGVCMRKIIGLGLACVLAGCAAAPHQVRDRDDYLAEASRVYPRETRERVLKAAETVLRISDPADFEFRYTLSGFTGLRRYFIYAVIASASGREKWDFMTEPEPAGLRASVSISEEGTASGGYSANRYENAMASSPLYRLFWARVEYMLNKRPDWVTCEQAAAELQDTNTNATTALGGLCGPTSDGRNAPPPDQLPPLISRAGPAPGPQASRTRPRPQPVQPAPSAAPAS